MGCGRRWWATLALLVLVAAEECARGDAPVVRVGGRFITPPVTESHSVGGRLVELRALSDELQLTHLRGLVDTTEVDALVRMAAARDGFIKSPLKSQASGERLDGDARRTSSSCPMLWPILYAGREDEIRESRPELMEELELTDEIARRIAAFFSQAGVQITREHIEPLQLVRYTGGEAFGPHHDYHASGESSVQGVCLQHAHGRVAVASGTRTWWLRVAR